MQDSMKSLATSIPTDFETAGAAIGEVNTRFGLTGQKLEELSMHILSILDIKKMIPVPNGCYERIEFDELEDTRYKDLFEKEYAFCLKVKTKLLRKVEKVYQKQKETGIIRRANCNFSELEKAMLDWK